MKQCTQTLFNNKINVGYKIFILEFILNLLNTLLLFFLKYLNN